MKILEKSLNYQNFILEASTEYVWTVFEKGGKLEKWILWILINWKSEETAQGPGRRVLFFFYPIYRQKADPLL